jgi:hypothetical protein
MKRLVIYLGVSSLACFLGIVTSTVVSQISSVHSTNEPLRVTLLPLQPADCNSLFAHYTVRLENVSTKTIRGFSLGHTCDCLSWDSQDNPYPPGINFTNPSPEREILRPGDVQEMPLPDLGFRPGVWVDLVHFEGGDNWGPNRSHKEGYVRGY